MGFAEGDCAGGKQSALRALPTQQGGAGCSQHPAGHAGGMTGRLAPLPFREGKPLERCLYCLAMAVDSVLPRWTERAQPASAFAAAASIRSALAARPSK